MGLHPHFNCGDTYIYIYTTTGFGPRQNQKMAGVYHFVVYMQTAENKTVCIYTKEWSTPAIFLFFLRPNSVVVYIFNWTPLLSSPNFNLMACWTLTPWEALQLPLSLMLHYKPPKQRNTFKHLKLRTIQRPFAWDGLQAHTIPLSIQTTTW